MVLLAGPNGAGKSTLYETRIAPSFGAPFINADLIQRGELGAPSPEAAYRALEIAAKRREEHLAQGKSFATETVFSHPSKLELVNRAKAAGFTVILFHVGVDKADLSVERVRERVVEGGHPVPEQKIRERYDRNGPLIREAMLLSSRGFVFDNSRLNEPPERIMAFTDGRVTFVKPVLPAWTLETYRQDLLR